jgi:hypothetical protein
MGGVDDLMGRMRVATAILIACVLGFLVVRSLLDPSDNAVSPALANGTFYNPCCGKIVMKDGTMSFGNEQVHYQLQVIKTDLTASTDCDVGVASGHKVESLPREEVHWVKLWLHPYDNNMMNLYDASKKAPDRLAIWGVDGDETEYVFDRV